MGTEDEPILVFDEAVAVTLREMAGIEVAPRDRREVTGGEFAGVSALLQLRNGGVGYLVLSCSQSVAKELARRVFAESQAELDAGMIRDCVGEVANVIAGQAKTLLFGTPHHYTLSPPAFDIKGPPDPDIKRWVLTFASEIGEFIVQVRLPTASG